MQAGRFDELVENFELFDDWEERYRYVIELGKALPPFPDDLKTDATKVDGCVSRVWLDETITREDGETRLEFIGDSDAHIVRGLIAILRALLSGQRVEDVVAADIAEELARLDLSAHLSPQRSNGLTAMVQRIKSFAAAATEDEPEIQHPQGIVPQ